MKTKLAKVFRIKGQSALLRSFDESIENDVFFSDAEILKAIKESIEDVEAGRETRISDLEDIWKDIL